MRVAALPVILAVSLLGCDSKKSASGSAPARATTSKPTSTRAPLVDLTAASALAPVRAAFNAHEGEARFLTLLSPT